MRSAIALAGRGEGGFNSKRLILKSSVATESLVVQESSTHHVVGIGINRLPSMGVNEVAARTKEEAVRPGTP